LNKKEARETIEGALNNWPGGKIDKTLLMIELLENVKEGKYQ